MKPTKHFRLLFLATALILPSVSPAGDGTETGEFKAAVALMQARQFGDATVLLEKVMAEHPADIEVMSATAYAQTQSGAVDDAFDTYRRLLRVYLMVPNPTERQTRRAGHAREYIVKHSVAVKQLLGIADGLKTDVALAKTSAERGRLVTAYAATLDIALGPPPEGLGRTDVDIDSKDALTKEQIEKNLGYKLSHFTRLQHHRDAVRWKNGHYYKYFPANVTWDEAFARCREMGGYLATINSAAESKFLSGLILKDYGGYVGGTDAHKEDDWSWITGEPWGYSNWAPEEPNDFGGDEDHLLIWPDGSWNDEAAKMGFICEWQ